MTDFVPLVGLSSGRLDNTFTTTGKESLEPSGGSPPHQAFVLGSRAYLEVGTAHGHAQAVPR